MDQAKVKKQIIQAISHGDIDEDWEDKVTELISVVEELSSFSPVSRRIPCSELNFESQSLRSFLEGAESCIVMAATLGPRIDSRLALYQMTDMARAYVFDIVCLHYIEAGLDEWETAMRGELSKNGEHLSERFSPGYGDLDLSVQSGLLNLIDAKKRIGIELTGSGLMIPQKSVTAILGIKNEPFSSGYSRCDACMNRSSCNVQGGGYCELHK